MWTIGHRGAAGHAPENTLASIEQAIVLGADAVEVDIRRTRDGELVLFHDDSLDRVLGLPGGVGDYDYAELSRHPIAGAGPIPRLADACRLLAPTRLWLMAEVKEPDLEEPLLATLLGWLPRERFRVAAFDLGTIRRIKELDQQVQTIALLEGDAPDPVRVHAQTRCDLVAPCGEGLTPAWVDCARAIGLGVVVWTLNEPSAIRAAVALEVDGVISDFPDRVLDALSHGGG